MGPRRSTLLLVAGISWFAVLATPVVAAAEDTRASLADKGANANPDPTIAVIAGRNIHNVGDIWLNVTNFGVFGSQPGSNQPWSEAASAQWPAPSATEYLYSAGLWVGALNYGVPAVTTAQPDMEFRPDHDSEARVYVAREGDPNGARAPAPNLDDDRDGRIDEDPLNGRDDDGDGRIDEDFAAISSQMFACEYSDIDPAIRLRYPDHRSLGLQVQQTTMAWEGAGKRDFIAMNFKITTRQSLQDVYVGLFADPDIGPPDRQARAFDDMAGFWEGDVESRSFVGKVHVSMGYMWDADGDEGQSKGYVGFTFLGLERTGFGTNAQNRRVQSIDARNFRFFTGRSNFILGGDPTNDDERYQVLNGSAPGSLPSQQPRAAGSRAPNDYRFVVSSGPFGSLSPGDTLGITVAFLIADGFEGLKQAAARARLAFNGAWADCDGDVTTGVDGFETRHCAPEDAGRRYPIRGPDEIARLGVVPCDTVCGKLDRWWESESCALRVPQTGCLWIDGDCDAKTGVDGKECLVHWFSDVPPPPPHMRLVGREDHVEVYFDNRSELAVDPILNVGDFESYRIWRADDWNRPAGSGLDTGPQPDRWMLVAEYDVPGNGIGLDSGFEEIRYRPRLGDAVIEFCREWDRAHPQERPPSLPGFTEAQMDTAIAMARGVKYYRWIDPPFIAPPTDADPPCGVDGACAPIQNGSRLIFRRCDTRGRCRAAQEPPHPGAHYFYSVTATDHRLGLRDGVLVALGAGLQGVPQGNFRFVDPSTDALQPADYDSADQEIYVVPNPATPQSMAAWALLPNNADATGIKIEFHHLPAAQGKVSIFTLAGDLVKELPFDGSSGNGSLAWNLVSRNGQDVTSGVYIYSVEAEDSRFKRFVSKFVVVR